ncbi:hypothetical protein AS156_24590 [Bradyrhizobium macuxiense]|uniref:Uncharacterized protein n=1 Tax=Bradyrhizobium macuxiense TaxID=1755647 RepID=A0A109J7W2_9BRAD|nr:hypothetical protein AS156_24590 [Bradyrhizobium macuxiense]
MDAARTRIFIEALAGLVTDALMICQSRIRKIVTNCLRLGRVILRPSSGDSFKAVSFQARLV